MLILHPCYVNMGILTDIDLGDSVCKEIEGKRVWSQIISVVSVLSSAIIRFLHFVEYVTVGLNKVHDTEPVY